MQKTKLTPVKLPADDRPQLDLSIVIPAYNESSRIVSTLKDILEFVQRREETCEVLVVDDGSTDDTVDVIAGLSQDAPLVRLLRNPGNRGKGYAVQNGMLHARGEYLLFSDADLSTPIAELDRLLDPLKSGFDVVLGSRALKPEWVSPRQPWSRQVARKIFNLLVGSLGGVDFRDTQCGFKAFRGKAGRATFSRQTIPGFGFDVEVLYLARKLGYRTLEVPVHWANDTRSKVRPSAMESECLLICLGFAATIGRGNTARRVDLQLSRILTYTYSSGLTDTFGTS